MDWIRVCYRSKMRLWADSDELTPVRWFRVCPKAQWFPGPSIFRSLRTWIPPQKNSGVGEKVPDNYGYDLGQNLLGYPGVGYCGRAAAFRLGGDHKIDPVIVTKGNGSSDCCPRGVLNDGPAVGQNLGGTLPLSVDLAAEFEACDGLLMIWSELFAPVSNLPIPKGWSVVFSGKSPDGSVALVVAIKTFQTPHDDTLKLPAMGSYGRSVLVKRIGVGLPTVEAMGVEDYNMPSDTGVQLFATGPERVLLMALGGFGPIGGSWSPVPTWPNQVVVINPTVRTFAYDHQGPGLTVDPHFYQSGGGPGIALTLLLRAGGGFIGDAPPTWVIPGNVPLSVQVTAEVVVAPIVLEVGDVELSAQVAAEVVVGDVESGDVELSAQVAADVEVPIKEGGDVELSAQVAADVEVPIIEGGDVELSAQVAAEVEFEPARGGDVELSAQVEADVEVP